MKSLTTCGDGVKRITYERKQWYDLKYWTTPMKLLVLVVVDGIGHFRLASTFVSSTLSFPPKTTFPRYTDDVLANSHF
jgi:hypothetical protein